MPTQMYWVISQFCFDKLSTLKSFSVWWFLKISLIFWKAWAREPHALQKHSQRIKWALIWLLYAVRVWLNHLERRIMLKIWLYLLWHIFITFSSFQTSLLSRLRWDCICYFWTCDFKLFKMTSQYTNPYVTVLSSLLCCFPLVRGFELFGNSF